MLRITASIQLSLAQINFIIAISIRLSTQIRSACLYHTGISLILTLLSYSTSIEPWDESMLTLTTTNCSTWASTYRLASPPSYYLHRHIQSSSASDPFVLKALVASDEGSPLFTQASLSDWSFDSGHLYFHKRLYVPPSACSALLHLIHASPLSGHMRVFYTKSILECDFWWPGLSTFVKYLLLVVLFASRTRLTLILPFLLSV